MKQRTIKFRAWHKEEKKWFYFVIKSTKEAMEDINCFNFFALVSSPEMHDKLENWCQFIGLKDKQNREIFERDIVKVVNEPDQEGAEHMQGTGVVSFDTKDLIFGWSPTLDGRPHKLLTWGGTKSIEIIGNIYEDKKLLK